MNLDSKVIIWYNYYVIDPCAVLYIISKYGVFTAEYGVFTAENE